MSPLQSRSLLRTAAGSTRTLALRSFWASPFFFVSMSCRFHWLQDEGDVASRLSSSCTRKRVTSAESSVHGASSWKERQAARLLYHFSYNACGRVDKTHYKLSTKCALAEEPVSPLQKSFSNSELDSTVVGYAGVSSQGRSSGVQQENFSCLSVCLYVCLSVCVYVGIQVAPWL